MLGKYTKINAIVTAASTNWAYLWQQQAKESVPTHAQRLQALTPQAKATHKIRGISPGCVTRNGAKKPTPPPALFANTPMAVAVARSLSANHVEDI